MTDRSAPAISGDDKIGENDYVKALKAVLDCEMGWDSQGPFLKVRSKSVFDLGAQIRGLVTSYEQRGQPGSKAKREWRVEAQDEDSWWIIASDPESDKDMFVAACETEEYARHIAGMHNRHTQQWW